jgi:hypothetical protein
MPFQFLGNEFEERLGRCSVLCKAVSLNKSTYLEKNGHLFHTHFFYHAIKQTRLLKDNLQQDSILSLTAPTIAQLPVGGVEEKPLSFFKLGWIMPLPNHYTPRKETR